MGTPNEPQFVSSVFSKNRARARKIVVEKAVHKKVMRDRYDYIVVGGSSALNGPSMLIGYRAAKADQKWRLNEVFHVDDKGKLEVLQESPPEDLKSKVEVAEKYCPTGAISIEF